MSDVDRGDVFYPGDSNPAAGAIALGEYGDGSDGDVTINAGTTTLTRDMYYDHLTVAAGGTLAVSGAQGTFRIFCKSSVTIAATGAIVATGSSGVAAAGGGAGVPGTVGAGGAGGAGAANGGVVGSSVRCALGAAGGAGGLGTAGGGAAAGTVTVPESVRGSVRGVPQSVVGRVLAGSEWAIEKFFEGSIAVGAGASSATVYDFAGTVGLFAVRYPVRRTFTRCRLAAVCESNTSTGATRVEVYKNGAATGLFVSVPGVTAGSQVYSASASIAWSDTDGLDLQLTNPGGVGAVFVAATLEFATDEGPVPVAGGAGGGGGTGDGANAGGGGGAGGGVLLLAARIIANNGVISAAGGAGGNAVAGNSGGGGGGGGGLVLLTRARETGTGSVDAAGGGFGTKLGTGVNGVGGGAGTIVRVSHG